MSDSSIVEVPFRGDLVQAARSGDAVWVVVKRVCEALGIAEQRQASKLRGKPWATTTLMVAVAEDGKNREVFCIHLDSLPMWLATIELSRVRPEARDKLVGYQRECARVLRDHFFGLPADVAPPLVLEMMGRMFEALSQLTLTVTGLSQQVASMALHGHGFVAPWQGDGVKRQINELAELAVRKQLFKSARAARGKFTERVRNSCNWNGTGATWRAMPAGALPYAQREIEAIRRELGPGPEGPQQLTLVGR